MTHLLLAPLLTLAAARAADPPEPPQPLPTTEQPAADHAVEIDADITIDGLQIQVETGKEGAGEVRIQVDGQELVIRGDQAQGQLQLGDLRIQAEGDQLRVEDASGESGVIQLGGRPSTED